MPQLKAIYNDGVSGSLPMASIVRNTAKDNIIDGGQYAIDTASYGHLSARCGFNTWEETVSATLTWNFPATGYDSDGVTRLACAYRTLGQLLCIWLNTDIDGAVADGGSPVIEFSLLRASSQTVNEGPLLGSAVVDIMQGASTDEGDVLHNESTVALRARAAICMPGCFLFLCERIRNTVDAVWKTEGVALVAMQHDGRGGFTRKWLGDLQTDYLGDPFFSGWGRGREWMLTTYFPFTLQQSPCLRAFIPIVDYIIDAGHVGDEKKGGQVGIIEATRADIDSDWSFGDIFKIPFEKEEDGVHFHTAAWTPRGVVLAMGDGNGLNENVLFTCDDWDDYTESSNWTVVRRAYGSGEYGGVDPEHGYANQWGGCVPHATDINKVIVGGDNVSAAVYVMEVFDNLTMEFQPLFGYMPGNDLQGHVTLGMSSAGPENSNNFLVRSTAQVNAETLHAPLIYGVGELAVAVAKTPSTGTGSNRWAIHGDDIYSFGLTGSGASVHKMAQPTITSRRGLAIGPGGINLLEIDGTDYFSDVAFPTCVISTVIDATAPGSNPVLDVETPSSTGDTRLFRINVADLTYAFTANSMYVVLWVKDMSNTGIPVRMTYIDNSTGGDTIYTGKGYYTGVTVDDWHMVVFTLENHATPWPNPHRATLTFSHSLVVGPSHFRIQFQGVYPGPQCPYLIAPQTTSTNEEVEQKLTALGANWSVGIELHIPMGGEDYELPTHPTTIMDTVALATVYVDSQNYVEITADLVNDEIDFLAVVSGTPQASQAVSFVALQRDSIIILAVTFDGTDLDFFAACGGLDERGLQTATVTADIGSPVSVRIGDNDFSQVPNTELFMVAVDDEVALDAAGVLAMLASEVEVGVAQLTTPTVVNDPDAFVFYTESSTDPVTTHTAFVVAAGLSLVVMVATRDQINDAAAPITMTYDGENMTLVGTSEANHPASYAFVLTSPAATVGDIIIEWGDAQIGFTVVPVTLRNLDKTNPVNAVAVAEHSTTTTSHAVGPLNVLKNSLLLRQDAFVLSDTGITPPAGMTEIQNFQDPVPGIGAMGSWLGSMDATGGGTIAELTLITLGTRRSATILLAFSGAVASVSESGGSGYAAMSHANLVTPKII